MQAPVSRFVRHVPKYETQYIERVVEVPRVQYQERVVEVSQVRYQEVINVEVPQVQYQEIIKQVPKDVIQEVVRLVPRYETRYVEYTLTQPQAAALPMSDVALNVDPVRRQLLPDLDPLQFPFPSPRPTRTCAEATRPMSSTIPTSTRAEDALRRLEETWVPEHLRRQDAALGRLEERRRLLEEKRRLGLW